MLFQYKLAIEFLLGFESTGYLLLFSLPATTKIPEFTRTPENKATTIFSGIRVGICTQIASFKFRVFCTFRRRGIVIEKSTNWVRIDRLTNKMINLDLKGYQ